MLPESSSNAKKGIEIYPSYLNYDENDAKTLCMSLLKEHSVIYIYALNEYTVYRLS